MSEGSATAPVTVVGAGVMGSALARALLAAGHPVTVWNRTPYRAEPLHAAGATLGMSLVEAIEASEVTVMCVANQAAASELLADGAVLAALRGRTLVQLTTGTPADGRRSQAFAEDRGITYLDGAIMAYPRSIGTAAAVILYSGPQAAFDAQAELLRALGTAHYVGEDAGRPAVIDAALIAFYYGTLAGFIHGASLVRREGIDLAGYLELARPFFATFVTDAVQETGERIIAGDYSDAQSSMYTHLGGIDLLVVGSSREAGLDHEIMTAIKDTFARAVAAGRGDEDIASLIEVASGDSTSRA
jgi:3-hydroxyisobutyrate dehydrogenase-like beta-hydroxyacid dehydrogenase